MSYAKRIAFVLLVCASCSVDPDTGQRAVALEVDGMTSTTVVFAAQEHASQLDAIVHGERPMDFHWIGVVVPADLAQDLGTDAGVNVDLATTGSGLIFMQVYRDVCNPAANDFSPCWLYEEYTAGQGGLSGSLHVASTETTAAGAFSVTWEGLTDRFQGQLQWHRHETSAGVSAAMIDGGAE